MLAWLYPWEYSPAVVMVMLVSAWLYVRGAECCKPALWSQVIFWLGFVSLYIAWHTELDYYAEHAFFMHRLQHSFLHHLSPFLLALSRPGKVLKTGLPQSVRIRLEAMSRNTALQQVMGILNQPLIAVILFSAVTLVWLWPPVHFVAMMDVTWYRLMGWSMVVNGLMFWSLTLNNHMLYPAHHAAAIRMLILLAVIPPQIIAGLLLVMARDEIYMVYTICGRVFAGIGPLEDQQLGGLILWIHGAMMSVAGIIVVWIREWLPRRSV